MRIFSFSSMAVSCFISKSSRSGSSSSSEIFDGFLFWKSFFNPSNLRLSLLRVPSSIASISSEEYLVDKSSTTSSGASKSCFRLLRTFSRNPCRIFSNRRISLSRVLVIFNASKSSEEYRAAISSSTKSGGTSSSSS